jgi:D-alanine-D-alanine ligase
LSGVGNGSTSTISPSRAPLSGDRERLISREVIVHDELGVIADQFYAERLYTRESIGKLLEKTGFRNIRHHGNAEALSDRDQDLGMMARRLLLSADAPQLSARKPKGKVQQLDVTVDGRPAPSRRGEA